MVAFLMLETFHDRHVLRAHTAFLFYVFFEAGLIPMFIIIGVWGGRDASTRHSSSFSIRCLARYLMLHGAIWLLYYASWNDGYPDLDGAIPLPVDMQMWLWLACFR
jgi:NADH-quinone oxidoreductase subunit M